MLQKSRGSCECISIENLVSRPQRTWQDADGEAEVQLSIVSLSTAEHVPFINEKPNLPCEDEYSPREIVTLSCG